MKLLVIRSLLVARAAPPRWMERLAKPVGIPVIIVCLLMVYGLVAGRIVLNGSDSLAARGFYVVVWPKPLIRGSIVVADPPAAVAQTFDGLVFAKRLVGLPGDPVIHSGDAVCILGACFAQGTKDGDTYGSLMEAGRVPAGHVALFGETATSLDSRYAEIGYFPIASIRGVGVAIPGFPSWEDIARRLGS